MVHEWFFDPLSPTSLLWKKVSSEKEYTKAIFQIGKRFEKKSITEGNAEKNEGDFSDEYCENNKHEEMGIDKSTAFKPIPFNEVAIDSWILVTYEDEYFLGKVIEKNIPEKTSKVTCLEKPFGITELQEMEKERHATSYYEWQIFYPPTIPELKQAARGWKYTYTL